MKEEFISYLWKNKLIDQDKLLTSEGESILVIHPGTENRDAGPDYFNSRIKIGNTIWAGNVEIHVRSSDWKSHRHEANQQYDNVILHVVHDNDALVLDTNQKPIRVLETKNKYNFDLLARYQKLMGARSWVACQADISEVGPVLLQTWLDRLLVERLERKSEEVVHYFRYFNNDWDQTFFFFLAKNFGFKVNGSPFGILAQRTPYLLLQKNRDNLTVIEAILFGQAGLLNDYQDEFYPRLLFKEYSHQSAKYNLNPIERSLWKFAKLRPVNFPNIRISQLAGVVHGSQHLFRSMVEAKGAGDIRSILSSTASEYWKTHYVFGQRSSEKTKNLGIESINNIIINTISPILFVYGKLSMNEICCEKAICLLSDTPPEKNSIISKWKSFGVLPKNSGESQALLELKKYFCNPKRCLSCPVGNVLLKEKKLLPEKSRSS